MISTGDIPAISCEKITEFERLEELAPHWRKWHSASAEPNIFQDWGWIRASWKAYRDNTRLRALAVYEGTRIIGILPLVQKGNAVGFLGCPDSDCNDLLCEEKDAGQVLEAALGALFRERDSSWRKGILENLPPDSRVMKGLAGLSRKTRSHVQLIAQYPAPTVLFGENKAETLDALIAKARRKSPKKLRGEVRFRHLETREEARAHLDRFFQQHITRWAMNGTKSQFLQPDRRAFFAALVEELDPQTELRFAVLEADSVPVAYHLGFQLGGRFVWYKPSFDVNYWDYNVGDLLLRYLFEYAKVAGLDEYDMSIGDEPYKYRFANHVRQTYALYLDPTAARLRTRAILTARQIESHLRRKPEWKTEVRKRLEQARSLRTLLRRLPDLKWCARHFRGAVKRTLWASGEASIYQRSKAAMEPSQSGLTCTRARLDQIAAALVNDLDESSSARLHEYRRRLKQGDSVWIARNKDGGTFILSIGKRAEIAVPEIGPDCRYPLPEPAQVLYECYSLPEGEVISVPPEIIPELSSAIPGEWWFHQAPARGASQPQIEQAGFSLKIRLLHFAFFNKLRKTWIEVPESEAVSLQTPVDEVIRANR